MNLEHGFVGRRVSLGAFPCNGCRFHPKTDVLKDAFGFGRDLQVFRDFLNRKVDLFVRVVGVNKKSQSGFVARHDWVEHGIGANSLLKEFAGQPDRDFRIGVINGTTPSPCCCKCRGLPRSLF